MKRISTDINNRLPSNNVSENIDIDVTPVMNMFVILIPFLVSMAVFTHLSVIQFNLPQNVNAGIDDIEKKPRPKPTIVLEKEFTALTLAGEMLDSIPFEKNKSQDLSPIAEKLSQTRNSIADTTVIIASKDGIKLQRIIRVMDFCNSEGFTDIGLSSAPGETGG